jgi:hypothetical protein
MEIAVELHPVSILDGQGVLPERASWDLDVPAEDPSDAIPANVLHILAKWTPGRVESEEDVRRAVHGHRDAVEEPDVDRNLGRILQQQSVPNLGFPIAALRLFRLFDQFPPAVQVLIGAEANTESLPRSYRAHVLPPDETLFEIDLGHPAQ